jgi:hypothetical protein
MGTLMFAMLAALVLVCLAAQTAAPMVTKMAAMTGLMTVGSNHFDGELGGDTPSHKIVWLLLELDNMSVSTSAAEFIGLSCGNWEGLVTFLLN